jgi:hypothetical protein
MTIVLRTGAGVALSVLALACDRSTGTNAALVDMPHWTVTPEVTIGSVDGDVTFGFVGAVRIGPGGDVYVSDLQRSDLQVFTPDGTPVRVIGRAGQGPGEFGRAPSSIGWWGDTLWAFDFQSRRINGFDREGRVLFSRNPPVVQAGSDDRPYSSVTPLGRTTFIAGQSLSSSAVARREITTAATLLVDSTGAVLDTLYTRDLTNQTWEIATPNSALYMGQPFSDNGHAVVLQREDETIVDVRWVYEPSPEIEMVRRSFTNDTVYRTTLAFAPVAVTDSMVDAALASGVQVFRRNRQDITESEAGRLARAGLYVPQYLRPVMATRGGPDGSVWLQLREASAAPDSTTMWVVVDGRGRATRVVRLPARFSLQVPGETFIWGVHRDELDVTYVVRARLVALPAR